MAANINYIIPQQQFELIRDQIGLIIALELSNQYILQPTQDVLNAKVFLERFIPFDDTELPAINIYFDKETFSAKNHLSAVGDLQYNIDCHVLANDEDGKRGDYESSIKLHKLLGTIRYILASAEYLRLGLTAGIVEKKEITSIAVAPSNVQDSNHINIGRISFSVRSSESVQELSGSPVESIQTNAKIESTDKGYTIKIINT